MAITESWLNSTINDQLVSLDGFMPPERRDSVTGREGGIMIYCATDIPYKRRTDLEGPNSECLWIEISCPSNTNVLFGVYYRPTL